jgi:hypothetical protein
MSESGNGGDEPRPPRWIWVVLVGAWLVCVCVCYPVLRYFTSFPVWLCVVLSFPSGVGLFLACVMMAEHG